ncbi:MAG TPA: DUF554 family protein [Verrucomicrobiae bacterium]|jgi:hypothetical protein|nr:DUF554 family protein [Verrucomicrobiae bacterium]
MTGAIINAVGIVIGSGAALLTKKTIPAPQQNALKTVLGAALVWFGLRLTWTSLNGSFGQIFKQLAIVLLAMALGQFLGKLLRLQKLSNRVGQYASRALAAPAAKPPFSVGFVVASALFCLGPLAILGSVQEGLDDLAPTLIVKAVIDGLTAMSFVAAFGWSVLPAALPTLALEGALIRAVALGAAALHASPLPLADSIMATDGLLIFSVALIVLEVRKVPVADYLPSLALAPLLTCFFK